MAEPFPMDRSGFPVVTLAARDCGRVEVELEDESGLIAPAVAARRDGDAAGWSTFTFRVSDASVLRGRFRLRLRIEGAGPAAALDEVKLARR